MKKKEEDGNEKHETNRKNNNNKMIDLNLISSKENGLNIPIFKYKGCQLRFKKQHQSTYCLHKTI